MITEPLSAPEQVVACVEVFVEALLASSERRQTNPSGSERSQG
jgi:hypothetical protein